MATGAPGLDTLQKGETRAQKPQFSFVAIQHAASSSFIHEQEGVSIRWRADSAPSPVYLTIEPCANAWWWKSVSVWWRTQQMVKGLLHVLVQLCRLTQTRTCSRWTAESTCCRTTYCRGLRLIRYLAEEKAVLLTADPAGDPHGTRRNIWKHVSTCVLLCCFTANLKHQFSWTQRVSVCQVTLRRDVSLLCPTCQR